LLGGLRKSIDWPALAVQTAGSWAGAVAAAALLGPGTLVALGGGIAGVVAASAMLDLWRARGGRVAVAGGAPAPLTRGAAATSS
jgi:hypothetical protein